MATRTSLTDELESRLGDSSNAIWTAAELKAYIDFGIKNLYPSFYVQHVATTTATAGPIQAMPAGARNLHMIGLQRTGATRVRPLRKWQEGDGQAFIPQTGIDGSVLVWGWTSGWDAPSTDSETLAIPPEAEDVVVIQAHIKALERLLSDRVSLERYFSLNVRQAASEADIADTIDGLRQGLNDRLASALPLPEKRS